MKSLRVTSRFGADQKGTMTRLKRRRKKKHHLKIESGNRRENGKRNDRGEGGMGETWKGKESCFEPEQSRL